MRVGAPGPGHLLGISTPQVAGHRSGAACPGVLPLSLLLMAWALHSEGVLGAKDVVFKSNPEGLVNFPFFFFLFFKHGGQGSVFKLRFETGRSRGERKVRPRSAASRGGGRDF